MNKKVLFCIVAIAVSTGVFCAPKKKDSFLIPKDTFKKRATKNQLKENIGEKLKNSLYQCNSLSNSLGAIQQKLAQLQRTLIDRVDDLIDDSRRFRKAKRADLLQASKIMTCVASQLSKQEERIEKLVTTIDSNPCLAKAKPCVLPSPVKIPSKKGQT